MANLISTVIGPNSDNKLIQYDFYKYMTTASTPSYIHMKTNNPILSGQMSMIEAIGYNFGLSLPIRCAWTMYTYGGGGVYPGMQNCYGGLNADNIYASSDGYAVIVAYATTLYYCGFSLNAYQTAGNGRGLKLSILASAQSASATGVY
jgi:hypothetical protein